MQKVHISSLQTVAVFKSISQEMGNITLISTSVQGESYFCILPQPSFKDLSKIFCREARLPLPLSVNVTKLKGHPLI